MQFKWLFHLAMVRLKKALIHPYVKLFTGLGISLGMVGWSSDQHPAITLTGEWPGYARGAALDICIRGNFAYVAAGRAGLMVFDVSNPLKPIRIGGFYLKGESRAVYVDGNRAYLALGTFNTGGCAYDPQGRLVIMDVSQPNQPALLGEYRLCGRGDQLVISGHYAYIAAYDTGLLVVDVSNPNKPMGVSSLFTANSINGLDVSGNNLYLTMGGQGLQVLDISQPAKPVCVGSYGTPDARAVKCAGRLACVADASEGLLVLDIGDPAKPVLGGSFPLEGDFQDIEVAGTLACLAAKEELHFFDIIDPAKPLHLNTFPTRKETECLAFSGPYAYVADGVFGLQVIDLAKPTAPLLAGVAQTSASAVKVQVAGRYGYVAESIGFCPG